MTPVSREDWPCLDSQIVKALEVEGLHDLAALATCCLVAPEFEAELRAQADRLMYEGAPIGRWLMALLHTELRSEVAYEVRLVRRLQGRPPPRARQKTDRLVRSMLYKQGIAA